MNSRVKILYSHNYSFLEGDINNWLSRNPCKVLGISIAMNVNSYVACIQYTENTIPKDTETTYKNYLEQMMA